MLGLAAPLALAELGWMGMGIVDTIMVGRVHDSAVDIGAVSLGSVLFYAVAISGSGLLLGLDTLVSHSYGAGDVEDCHHSLVHGIYISLVLTPLLMGLIWLCIPLLRSSGIQPDVLLEAIPYLKAITWSTLPLLLYFAFRRYLQGMNLVRPVTFALVSANLVNLVGNWMLVYGHLGAPAMGVVGSGWATCISRIYMALSCWDTFFISSIATRPACCGRRYSRVRSVSCGFSAWACLQPCNWPSRRGSLPSPQR
jgi:MATE family multidrug resistance protein